MYNKLVTFIFKDTDVELAATLDEIKLKITESDLLVYKGSEYKGKLASVVGILEEEFINYFKEKNNDDWNI